MNYYVAPTSSINIINEKSHGMAEVTITLTPTGPVIETFEPNYIGGVYDLSSGKKNPGIPYCEVQEKSPSITDDWVFISDSTPSQLTLNLITNINQI